ncbi:unnamed protein product [Arabidopsis thaliana]|uniref:HAT C-terminal dimerisation domain-containing protein n=1 Tax=Arabidopsis thaliana TaxID=3702 RepID=A0A654FDD4_ARATH|nr:unnamed protein product [Arabidopsis thaliana]
MEIEQVFPIKPKRLVKKKKQFGEDVEKIDESKTAKESFRIHYFMNIMDQAIMSIERLKVAEDDELRTSCMKLEASLKHDVHSDVDGEDLFMELKLLKDVLPKEIIKPVEVLDFLKRMDGCYPNTWITYRILLTIPVSIASAERTFPKLKLIKNYLRSTVPQERLNGLALISIEQELERKQGGLCFAMKKNYISVFFSC